MVTSNETLIAYLTDCDAIEVSLLIGLLRSRLSPESRRLCTDYPNSESVPAAGSEPRCTLANRVVKLLGWYGSNTIGYGARRLTSGDGSKQYYAVALDTANLLRKRINKKHRPDIPHAPHLAQLEQMIVSMCLDAVMASMTTEELEQQFREAGLDEHVAAQAAKDYSPGLAAGGLPFLVKLLGKKTVSTMISQMVVSLTARFLGKEAASTLAKQLLVRLPQKMFAKVISVIGWVLLAADFVLFATSPARRITVKSVAFIAACRVKAAMDE